jgi:hypothetical protein
MVRRRSTVRFRNGAPGQRVISNTAIQDQETKFQDQETNAAMTGLDGAMQPDKKALLACGYRRSRPLRVSVARRIGHIVRGGRAARSVPAWSGRYTPFKGLPPRAVCGRRILFMPSRMVRVAHRGA